VDVDALARGPDPTRFSNLLAAVRRLQPVANDVFHHRDTEGTEDAQRELTIEGTEE